MKQCCQFRVVDDLADLVCQKPDHTAKSFQLLNSKKGYDVPFQTTIVNIVKGALLVPQMRLCNHSRKGSKVEVFN